MLALLLTLPVSVYAQVPTSLAFELSTSTGNKESLKQHLGKLVYVDFWASWCAPCLQSFPFMNSLQQKYQAAGLQIIAINLDKKIDDAQIFLSKNPAQFLVLFDPAGQTPQQYGVKGMPSSYLIDRKGKLISIHKGFKVADQEILEAKIKAALADKD
ncbi:TlpA family protein disulfide reductase [Undibacterium sp. Di24W]|uniref:TlpA family protein disulfide reductase n=1 Tax=Undibacterium sp. Di24W TaxID=3413033 RepID=UPI003BF3AFB9